MKKQHVFTHNNMPSFNDICNILTAWRNIVMQMATKFNDFRCIEWGYLIPNINIEQG